MHNITHDFDTHGWTEMHALFDLIIRTRTYTHLNNSLLVDCTVTGENVLGESKYITSIQLIMCIADICRHIMITYFLLTKCKHTLVRT